MYYKAEFAKFHALMPYVPLVLVLLCTLVPLVLVFLCTLVPYVPNMPFYSHAMAGPTCQPCP